MHMKLSWSNLVHLAAVMTLVSAPLFSQATSAQDTVGDKVGEGAKKTTDAVVKGAKTVAKKTEDGLSKTGEVMTDGWVTTRVHTRFVTEDLLKDSDISVDTDKHVVTLKGTVTTAAGRMKASTIAKNTEGVRRVVNQLTIGPKVSS